MITGRDLMEKLEIIVNFNSRELIRYNINVTIRRALDNHPKPTLNRSKINQVMQQTAKTKVIKETTEIIIKI